METYEFSGTFELGSLLIEPVHVRIEELRPVIEYCLYLNCRRSSLPYPGLISSPCSPKPPSG